MADCMECDEDIDENCDVCPGCGLDALVSINSSKTLPPNLATSCNCLSISALIMIRV